MDPYRYSFHTDTDPAQNLLQKRIQDVPLRCLKNKYFNPFTNNALFSRPLFDFFCLTLQACHSDKNPLIARNLPGAGKVKNDRIRQPCSHLYLFNRDI